MNPDQYLCQPRITNLFVRSTRQDLALPAFDNGNGKLVQSETMEQLGLNLRLLEDIAAIDSPSGDETELADFVELWATSNLPNRKTVRLGDNVIVHSRGNSNVAIFAHLDTTGYTVGYDANLIEIGSPDGRTGDILRAAGSRDARHVLWIDGDGHPRIENGSAVNPGDRLVFASPLDISSSEIVGPYLDNKIGVWAACNALLRSENSAAVFCCGEETSGGGARVCSRYIYDVLSIEQAIVCDVTWVTEHVRAGSGPAISLRDACLPRRAYVDYVGSFAKQCDLAFQIEVESSGASDGMWIEQSGYPIDWVFIGAPERGSHSSRETVTRNDARGMVDLIAHISRELSEQPFSATRRKKLC